MKKLFFVLLLISGAGLQAHQADISTTMLVERGEGQWLLQINASLAAFEYEVKTVFPEATFDSPEAFQQLVLDLMLANLEIDFNDGTKAKLHNGIVKLGHETNVVFELKSVPGDLASVSVRNTTFKDIHRNQSALVFLKKGFESKQQILDGSNGHTIRLVHSPEGYAVSAAGVLPVDSEFSGWLLSLAIGAFLVLVGLAYYFREG
jgi:hypothetical protein